jgi:SAM-dependent methyltransferase
MPSEYFEYLKSRNSARLFLRKLFLKPVVNYFSGRVLDIGSGIGEFLEMYAHAIGIDANMDCVAFCHSKDFQCVNTDVYALPFIDDSFDGVLLNNILEHLKRPYDVFQEIKRVLKNHGKLMIELPGKKGFYYDKTHVKYWEREETVMFLEQNGFEDIQTNYFPLPFRRAGDILTHNKLRIYARHAKSQSAETHTGVTAHYE